MGELSAAAYRLPPLLGDLQFGGGFCVRESKLKDWIIGRYKVKVKESFGFYSVSLSGVSDLGTSKPQTQLSRISECKFQEQK